MGFKVVLITFAVLLTNTNTAYSSDCIRRGLQDLLHQSRTVKLVPGTNDFGPRAFSPARPNARKIDDISELSFGQFNLENYLETGARSVVPFDQRYVVDAIQKKDKLSFVPTLAKPRAKENGVIWTIKAAKPDILVVQEIGGMVSLESLNQKLGGQYKSILIPSSAPYPGRPVNSINIGFLVKNDLPFDIEVQSFRNIRQAGSRAPLFSRDLPVIVLKAAGTNKPVMAIFGTHFKAMGDRASVLLRKEQMEMAARLVNFYSKKHEGLPVFLVGDFNFDVRLAEEFSTLGSSGLKDVFDLAPIDKSVPKEKRVTQFYYKNDRPKFGQLDSISGNQVVADQKLIKSAEIRPLVNTSGETVPVPKTHDEAKELVSDHAMLKTVIDFKALWERIKAR